MEPGLFVFLTLCYLLLGGGAGACAADSYSTPSLSKFLAITWFWPLFLVLFTFKGVWEILKENFYD